jgi:hypothetical protein
LAEDADFDFDGANYEFAQLSQEAMLDPRAVGTTTYDDLVAPRLKELRALGEGLLTEDQKTLLEGLDVLLMQANASITASKPEAQTGTRSRNILTQSRTNMLICKVKYMFLILFSLV